MSDTLPPGFLNIEADRPPPEPESEANPKDLYDTRRQIDYRVTTIPALCVTGTPEELAAKLYGCSGSLETTQYQEATKLRDMPAMSWAEARVALNRLVIALGGYSHRRRLHAAATSDLVALAEFALTARSFDFLGRKGDNAPKFRRELTRAVQVYLHHPLATRLRASVDNVMIIAKPIAEYMRNRWLSNEALRAMVPTSGGEYVRIRGGRLGRDSVSPSISGSPAGWFRSRPRSGRCAGRA